MAKRLKQIGVITGDLVGSSKVKQAERDMALEAIRDVVPLLQARGIVPKAVRLDVFRGDSWQLVTRSRLSDLAEAVCLIRSHVKQRSRLDTRVGLGIGGVEKLVPTEVSQSQGPGFVASGHALDGLAGQTARLAFARPGNSPTQHLERAVVLQLDAQIQSWTQRQSESVFLNLSGLKLAEIGKVMGITFQAAGKHLKAANIDLLDAVLAELKAGDAV